jgi:hypothetical protein
MRACATDIAAAAGKIGYLVHSFNHAWSATDIRSCARTACRRGPRLRMLTAE